MINLFEYQNKEQVDIPLADLDNFLDALWKKREKKSFFRTDESRNDFQRFLNVIYKTQEIKSNKYVGVIFFKGLKINLFPKIFYNENINYKDEHIKKINNHILWWLSYCKKINFPNYQSSLNSSKNDLFEILVYLFSNYTRKLISSSIFQQYEEVDNELTFIKGRLNVSEYLNKHITTGKWHKMQCIYDSFELDNTFNRIIKYVAKMLLAVVKDKDNIRNLRDILFILDEVTDVVCTAQMCSGIIFNPMLNDFKIVRDYCFLFLNNSISLNYKNDLELFAFFLPMDSLFEDFISGFIENEMPAIKLKAQSTAKALDTKGIFGLRPDLLLEVNNKRYIADAKYKMIYPIENNPKNSISQSDLYQMTAYAVRFKITDILLFYPNTVLSTQVNETTIEIVDELSNGAKISIHAYQLPIINNVLFNNSSIQENSKLSALFEDTRDELIVRLKNILS